MKYKQRLIEGVFLKRYKRFFADVELTVELTVEMPADKATGLGQISKKIEVAHVANTGSLKSINHPGAACLVSPADNPERKLRFTLEAIKSPAGSWVGVNTSLPNHLVREAFDRGLIPHWKKYETFRSEVKINAETRLDAVLTKGPKQHYVEVKNVTMAEETADGAATSKRVAMFPDAVTERGQKHLRELMELVAQGHTAEIFFTVQRGDCVEFRPADHIDPEYGRLLRQAHKAGVVVSAYVVDVSPTEIEISGQSLPVVL